MNKNGSGGWAYGLRGLCLLILGSMFMTASGCSGCSCHHSSGSGTKNGSTPPPPNPGTAVISTPSDTISEQSGTYTVTIDRVGGTLGAVSVEVAFSGTATSGTDYTIPSSSPITLNWADADATPQTIVITILDDLLADNAETITLTLQNPTGGLVLGAPATMTITLIDVWTKYPANPVLVTVPNTFTDTQVLAPSVIKRGPGDFVMWYNGWDGINGVDSFVITSSADGVSWPQGQIVLQNTGNAGDFDELQIWNPCVLYEPSTPAPYKMWYTGKNATTFAIGYATSSNGLSWTRQGVVLSPTAAAWDSANVGFASVVNDGGTYKMWYTGSQGSVFTGTTSSIGYATSPDGITWAKSGSNPVLLATGGTNFDSTRVRSPWVIKDGSAFRMWYGGDNGTLTQIGYARSADGISWTRFAGNPVIPVGAATSWEDTSTDFCSVLRDGNTFKMWYTGNYTLIGYASNP